MPATAGRVRMPHNNRVSTSGALKTSDIWSKTIGHDPYAASKPEDDLSSSQAEKTRGLLELARHQNLTGGRSGGGEAGGDDFARKMFLGLKEGKKRSTLANGRDGSRTYADARALLEEESSSSEDEYIEVKPSPLSQPKKDENFSSDDHVHGSVCSNEESKKQRKERKEKKKSKRKGESRWRRKEAKKKRKRRRRSSSSSDDDNSRSESSDIDSLSSDGKRRHSRKEDRKDSKSRGRNRRRHKDRKRDRDKNRGDERSSGYSTGGGDRRHRQHCEDCDDGQGSDSEALSNKQKSEKDRKEPKHRRS